MDPYHDARGRFTFAPSGTDNASKPEKKVGQAKRGHKPMSQLEVDAHAAHAMGQYHQELARGLSPEEAAGWAANSEVESNGDPASQQMDGGPGRGLFQWGANKAAFDRRITFQNVMHTQIEHSNANQQRAFRDWELRNTEKGAQNHIHAATTVGGKARAITTYYVRPADKVHAADDRARIAEKIYSNAHKK